MGDEDEVIRNSLELAIVVKPMIEMLRAKGRNDEQIAAALNEAARRAGVKLSVRVVDKEPD